MLTHVNCPAFASRGATVGSSWCAQFMSTPRKAANQLSSQWLEQWAHESTSDDLTRGRAKQKPLYKDIGAQQATKIIWAFPQCVSRSSFIGWVMTENMRDKKCQHNSQIFSKISQFATKYGKYFTLQHVTTHVKHQLKNMQLSCPP
jgi:hypothetical protein